MRKWLKLLTVINREGDLRYWKREAETWKTKYEASLRVRDQLVAQLEKTERALNLYIDVDGEIDE